VGAPLHDLRLGLVPRDPKQAAASAWQAVDADLGYSILARLQDDRSRLGLAQAVFPMQGSREESANRMTHLCLFPSGGSQQTVNDLRKKWACYSQLHGATLCTVDTTK